MRSLCIVFVAFGALACREPGQPDIPPPISVSAWSATVDTLPGTYTRVMSPAEFRDSLLIVPDVADGVVWRVNVRQHSRVAFGSKGNGPGEYQRAGWAVRLHQDSVALLWGSSHFPFPVLSVESGRGRTHALIRPTSGDALSAAMASGMAPLLRLADTLGHIYGASSMRLASAGEGVGPSVTLDTQPVVRFSTTTTAIDTLLLSPIGVPVVPTGRDADGAMTFGMSMGPYAPYNDWYAFADGRLAHVDAARYHVRLMNSSGEPLGAWTMSSRQIPVSDSGWQRYVQRTTNNSIAMVKRSVGQLEAQMGQKMKGIQAPRYVVPGRPRQLPEVNFGGGVRQMHGYGQTLWIPVHVIDPPDAEYWDVIDLAQGVRVTTIAMPVNHRLVHVTPRGAYVVAKDDDDVERILLYRTRGAR
ncbi:MAG: hypothetical protein IT353_13795 [Gemmatimonadaceae bacterium]|nr:hypothetical protein [Gemmatimonadaceae bacterium]